MDAIIPVIKDKEYYNINKKIFNKNYNSITKKYISRRVIGSCSYLFKKYATTSYKQFANRYFTDFDQNFDYYNLLGNEFCGRSLDQFICIVKKYHAEINNPSITFEMCFDDLINHVIIETIDGHKAEVYLIKKINSTNKYSINEGIGYIDAICGVDIIIKHKETGKVKYIQVKPITTFIGNTNESLIEDRKNFFQKQIKLNEYLTSHDKENEISEIEYMCYDKNSEDLKFLTIKGKHRFRLSDLCNEDGTTKIQYKSCIFETI